MKDIIIARNILDNENKSIVIVKNGNVIFSSNEKGIKPIFTALMEQGNELKGSSIADKVIGKAAAMICKQADIKELSTQLISENALNVLKDSSIIFKYDKSVPYIKNRDKSGMCPIEMLSLKVNDIDELLFEISKFQKSVNLQ